MGDHSPVLIDLIQDYWLLSATTFQCWQWK